MKGEGDPNLEAEKKKFGVRSFVKGERLKENTKKSTSKNGR